MSINKLFIKINQDISFSNFMMKGKASNSVFFPGCAFMKFDSDIIYKTLNLLKRYDEKVEVCSLCCGRPSEVLDDKSKYKYEIKLANYIKSKKISNIYLACPNCLKRLRYINNKYNLSLNIMMIYDILRHQLILDKNFNFNPINETVVVHDPCSIRDDKITQNSIRDILKLSKQKYVEANKNCENTICCGNINMLHIINKKASKKLTNICLKNLTEKSNIVLSYCNGCLYTFNKFNIKTIHIIEVIFGKIKKQTYFNRIKFVQELY